MLVVEGLGLLFGGQRNGVQTLQVLGPLLPRESLLDLLKQ